MSVDSVNGKSGAVEITGSDIDGVVRKVAGKTGDVTLTVNDVDGAAPKVNPSFTGEVNVPTPPVDDSSGKAASTQFVHNVMNELGTGQVKSVAGRIGDIQLAVDDVDGAAPLDSPKFLGVPEVPTAVSSDSSNKAASTQFVKDAIQTKANLESPNFQGQPTVPTASPDSNNEQIANTAFVKAALASVGAGAPPIIKYPTADTSKVVVSYNQSPGDGYGVAHIKLTCAVVSANGVNVGGVAKEYIVKVKFDVATSVISMIRDDAAVGGVFTVDHYANRSEFTFKAAVSGGKHLWKVDVVGIAAVQLTSSTPGSTSPSPTPTPENPRPTVPDQTLYAPYSFNETFDNGTTINPNLWNNKAWNENSHPTLNYNVSGGNLNLWPQKDGTNAWIPRKINTDGKFSMKYGFMEMEVQVPKGKGVRANLALRSHDLAGEYYIALGEFYPGGGVDSWWSNGQLESVNYTGGFNKFDVPYSQDNWRVLRNYVDGVNLSTGFHKYGIHWDTSGIQLYFDGLPMGPKIASSALTTSAYLEIELNYGGASGEPDNTLVEGPTNALKVNYVRAWPLASAQNPAPTPIPSITKVGYFGSDEVYGLDGANPSTRVANPFPLVFDTSLPTVPPYDVVNEGVQSTTLSELLTGTDGVHAQWSNFVMNTDIDVVVLCFGIPDSSSGTTVAQFTNDLRQMIDLALAQNIRVILQTPHETNSTSPDTYRQAVLQVASERGCHVIDMYTYLTTYRANNSLTINQMYPNGTLPNQATYNLMGQYAAQRFSQIMSGTSPAPGPSPSPGTPTPNGYIAPIGLSPNTFPVMSFNEEFDGTSLNMSLWNTKMWYEADNTRNNWSVRNGTLNLWVQEPFTKTNRTIDTDYKFEQQFGYFEMEAKLPYGWGQWPAFWLYAHRDASGNEYAGRPEIDIMEAYTGGGFDGAWSTNDWRPTNFGATVHHPFNGRIGEAKISHKYTAQGLPQEQWPDLSAAFHVYGVLWDADGCQFYFDGQPFGAKIPTQGAFNQPMYIMLDLWLGSNDQPLPGIPDSRTPQSESRAYQIKYVRAWKLGASHNGTTVIRGTYNMPQVTYNGSTGPAPSPTPATPAPSASTLPAHIVEFHGTSFVWGFDGAAGSGQVATPMPNYIKLKYPQLTVRNEGVNSSDSTKLLAGTDGVHQAWAQHVASSNANVMILQFGFSEVADLSITQWKANLTSLYNYAHGAGKKVIFVSVHVNQVYDGAAHAQAMKEVAQQVGAGYVDIYNYSVQTFTGGLASWMPDGYHLTQAGYTVVGQRIADVYDGIYRSLTGIGSPAPTPSPTPGLDPVPMGVPSAQIGAMSLNESFSGSAVNSSFWNPTMPFENENQDPINSYNNPDFSSVNYRVTDDKLKIWPDINSQGRFYRKTFSTDGKFFQRYGIFEVKAKLPRGLGIKPSVWLFTSEQSDPVRRDTVNLFQAYTGGYPNWATQDYRPNNFNMAVWDGPVVNGNQNLRSDYWLTHYKSPIDLSADFHTYTLVWDATGFTFYFDGQQIGQKVFSDIHDIRMYLVVSLWYGGVTAGTPSLDQTPRGESNSFEIEYIRAWKLANGSSQVSGTAPLYVPNTGSPSPTPAPVGYPVIALSDNFDDNSRDIAKWTVGNLEGVSTGSVSVSESNGRLQVTYASSMSGSNYSGYRSVNTYDLTGKSIFARLIQAPVGTSSETQMMASLNDNTHTVAMVSGNDLQFYTRVAGVQTNLASIPYSAATHAWLRLRHSTTHIYWETAPSTAAVPPAEGEWVQRASQPVPFAITGLRFFFGGGTWQAQANAGTSIWDDINISATSSPAPSPTPAPSSSQILPFGQNAADYALVFNDEFSSAGVPNSSYWMDTMSFETDDATVNYDVSGGNLRIWPITNGAGVFFKRTISSRDGKFERTYGFFEWEIQAPRGDGLRVTLGLFDPVNIRQVGFDLYTGAPSGGWANSNKEAIDFQVVLYNGSNDTNIAQYRASQYASVPNLSTGKNKLAIRWSSTDFKFYLNGAQVGPTVPNPGWNAPMYMLQGLWPATMETSFGAGTPVGTSNSFLVSYARSWSFGGTPTPSGMPVVTAGQPFKGNLAFFHNDSFWYKQIPTSTTLHPNNSALVTELARQFQVPPYYPTCEINTSNYAAPVYVVSGSAPKVKVWVNDPSKPAGWVPDAALVASWESVPFPPYVQPADGTDGECVIYDVTNDVMYEFWQLRFEGGQWRAAWGGTMTNVRRDNGIWSGFYGTTATGLPFIGGQITADELTQGQINHVMGFSLIEPGPGHVWPAQRDDGWATGGTRIVEGMRFRLDPNFNVDASNLHPVAKTIAKAAQKYGFVVWDKAGANSLRCQNPKSYTQLGLEDPYKAGSPGGLFQGQWNYQIMANFPWNQCQFMPDNYGQTTSPNDGSARTDVASSPTPSPTPTPTPTPSGALPYNTDGTLSGKVGSLIFSDEFNGASLNTAKWSNNFTHYSPPVGSNNYDVSGGCARIWAADPITKTNRTLVTDTKWMFKYGYMEAYVKMPYGDGFWPGFWTYSAVHDDAYHEEIDVFEAYCGGNLNNGGQTWANTNFEPIDYNAVLHGPQGGSPAGDVRANIRMQYTSGFGPTNLAAQFYRYGALWEPDGVTFYFNGKRLGNKVAASDINDFHFIAIQLWIGGASGENVTNDSKNSGRAILFDYVRVWALASGATQVQNNTGGSAVDPTTPV